MMFRISAMLVLAGPPLHRPGERIPSPPGGTPRPGAPSSGSSSGVRRKVRRSSSRRPIAACGNSDGDLPMIQWTAAGPGPSFCLLVRHTDEEREWAYDRESDISCLDKALDEAQARGWTVADMKRDWAEVFCPRTR